MSIARAHAFAATSVNVEPRPELALDRELATHAARQVAADREAESRALCRLRERAVAPGRTARRSLRADRRDSDARVLHVDVDRSRAVVPRTPCDTSPPAGVNFTAFASRLSSICRASPRRRAATMARHRARLEARVLRPRSCGADERLEIRRARSRTGTFAMSILTRPASSRAKFRTSLMRLSRCRWLRLMRRGPRSAPRCRGPRSPRLEQLGVSGDGVERRAQLVAHCREELRLRAIRLLRGLPRCVLRFQQPHPLERLRRLIADRRDVSAHVSAEHAPLAEA